MFRGQSTTAANPAKWAHPWATPASAPAPPPALRSARTRRILLAPTTTVSSLVSNFKLQPLHLLCSFVLNQTLNSIQNFSNGTTVSYVSQLVTWQEGRIVWSLSGFGIKTNVLKVWMSVKCHRPRVHLDFLTEWYKAVLFIPGVLVRQRGPNSLSLEK